uniref:G_PROTEIN_RECEP_F1_2 domain-containing protein n=1 Tax=Onchocerca volvulus TaxID=6282 RepID=A0A8R1XPT9_ONCVO
MNTCTYEKWNRIQYDSSFSQIFFSVTAFILLDLVIIVGNSLVIIDVTMKKKLRATIRMFTISLAIVDLMIAIVILPFNAINIVLKGNWIFGDFFCITGITMDIWMCTTSTYIITAISIDRFIAITKPLHYPLLVTRRRTYMSIIIILMGSFLLSSPNFLLRNIYTSVNNQCICIPAHAYRLCTIVSASLSFYVPMVLVTFLSAKIVLITRRSVTVTEFLDAVKSFNPDYESQKRLDHISFKVFRGNVQIKMEELRNTNKKDEAGSSRAKKNFLRKSYTNPNIHSEQRKSSQTQSLKHEMNKPSDIKSEVTEKKLQRDGASEEIDDLNIEKQYSNYSLLQIFSRSSKTKFRGILDRKMIPQVKAVELITFLSGSVIFCKLFFSILYGFSLYVSPQVWSLSSSMGHVTSALNPIIYFSLNHGIRNCFKKLFTCSINSQT